MTRFILLAVFLSFLASAQDVPPSPKPKDDGLSLDVTMKFIEEKLGSVGPVNYIFYILDSVTRGDATHRASWEMTNVRASTTGCRLDFHQLEKRDDRIIDDSERGLGLKEVEQVVVTPEDRVTDENSAKRGHPVLVFRDEPSVSELNIKFKNDSGKLSELYDQSLADRIAKALVHAVELCGGGNKDPF